MLGSAVGLVTLAVVAAGCDCNGAKIKSAGPVINVDPASVHFDGVPGRISEATLKVSNRGNGPLKLDRDPTFVEKDGDGVDEFGVSSFLEKDCDEQLRSTATRREIPPGGCALLTFRYIPNADGEDPAELHVFSNDGDTPDLLVPIDAGALTPLLEVCAYDGTTKIDCGTPGGPYEVNFGVAAPGASVARTLRLDSKGSRPLQVQSLVLAGDEDFTVTPMPFSKTLAPGESADLAATFAALAGGGREGNLVISSDDPRQPKLTVRLLATGDGSKLCLCVSVADGFCKPLPVADFGKVPLNGEAHAVLKLASCGTKALTLKRAEVTDGAAVFGAQAPNLGPGLVMTPGDATATLNIPLTFKPATADHFDGKLTLETDAEHGYVTLKGDGIVSGCRLEAASNVLDFGNVVILQQARRDITVANRGTSDCLLPSSATIGAGADRKYELVGFPASPTIPAGTVAKFTVAYTPQDGIGPDLGELTIPFGDAAGGVATDSLKVQLKGMPTATAVCTLVAQPGGASAFGRTLNFGGVRVHAEKVLSVTFQNTGSAPCSLQNGTIKGSALPLPGMPNDVNYFKIKTQLKNVLQPGESTSVAVSFAPDADRAFGSPLPGFPGGGMLGVSLTVNTSDDASFDGTSCAGFGGQSRPGCVSWALTGTGATSALVVLPSDVDFGEVTLGCRSAERTLTLYNVGSGTVTIQGFKVDPAPPPEIFRVAAPPPPLTIRSGGQVQITVRYRPAATGPVTGALYIQSDAAGAGTTSNPFTTVHLTGTGTTDDQQTDTFTQTDHPIADVLWVVDLDSDSMADKQQAIATNAQSFIAAATSAGTDYHLGVVSSYLGGDLKTNCGGGGPFGGPSGCTKGSSFNNVTIKQAALYHDTGARAWVERADANPAAEFASNARIGVSGDASGNETGLDAMYRALSDPLISADNAGFLRPEARLVVISISDDDDLSKKDTAFYAAFLQSLKPDAPEQVVFDAVAGDMPHGCTNGVDGDAPDRYADVVTRTGGKLYSICTGNYSSIAADLSLGSFGGRTRWVLSRPCDPSTLVVNVAGAPQRADTDYAFDGLRNAITFVHAPAPGATITARYTALCL